MTSRQTNHAKAPEISVLLIAYANDADMFRTLKDLLPLRASGLLEILVWRNSFSKSLDELLLAQDVPFFGDCQNVGFARAVNRLARHASGKYLLLLNPDCQLTTTALNQMCKRLKRDDTVGSIAPIILSPSALGKHRTVGAGFEPTHLRVLMEAVGVPLTLARFRDAGIFVRESSPRLSLCVDWLAGTCLMIRKRDFLHVGGLSERWFMYMEDVDLGGKLRKNGQTNVLIRDSVVHGSQPRSKLGADVRFYQIASLIDYLTIRTRKRRVLWTSTVCSVVLASTVVSVLFRPQRLRSERKVIGFLANAALRGPKYVQNTVTTMGWTR